MPRISLTLARRAQIFFVIFLTSCSSTQEVPSTAADQRIKRLKKLAQSFDPSILNRLQKSSQNPQDFIQESESLSRTLLEKKAEPWPFLQDHKGWIELSLQEIKRAQLQNYVDPSELKKSLKIHLQSLGQSSQPEDQKTAKLWNELVQIQERWKALTFQTAQELIELRNSFLSESHKKTLQ